MRKTLLVLAVFILFATILSLTLDAGASSEEYIYLTVMSGSMRPTLEVGDVVTVKTDINASQIYVAPQPDGDIIVIHPPYNSEQIFRRAIQKSYVNGTYYFRTKGDDNPMADSWEILEENIIGKVVAYSRSFYAGTWNEVAYNVTVSTNSTLANFNFESDKQVKFDITGYISEADNGFCNVTIPKNLLHCNSLYDWQVLLNGTSIGYIPNQNDTYTFIYFTYGYSIQNVRIIGTEFLTPPTVFIVSPKNKTYSVNSVPLTFTVSEPTSWIGYSLNGQMNVTILGNTSLPGLSDGLHSLIVYAKDTAGKIGSSEIIYFSINTQQTQYFPMWIIATIVAIAVVEAVLLVYFIKVKKTTEKGIMDN
jgi:signal peptidase I